MTFHQTRSHFWWGFSFFFSISLSMIFSVSPAGNLLCWKKRHLKPLPYTCFYIHDSTMALWMAMLKYLNNYWMYCHWILCWHSAPCISLKPIAVQPHMAADSADFLLDSLFSCILLLYFFPLMSVTFLQPQLAVLYKARRKQAHSNPSDTHDRQQYTAFCHNSRSVDNGPTRAHKALLQWSLSDWADRVRLTVTHSRFAWLSLTVYQMYTSSSSESRASV